MYDWVTILICIACIIIILIIIYNLWTSTPKKRADNTNNFINTMYRASTEYNNIVQKTNDIIENADIIIEEIEENEFEAALFEAFELTLDNLGILDDQVFIDILPKLEERVKVETANKVAIAETVSDKIEVIKEHKPDPQNVHDSTVLSSVNNILNIIKSDNKINYDMPLIDMIRNDFMDMDSTKMDKVEEVLNTISKKSLVYHLNMTDYQVLYCVYCRIYHPQNADNRAALIECLFDALYSCYEYGNVVCVTGRITHIVSSLATLDFDERTWQINRSEEYKNEIRDLLGKIIADVDDNTQLFVKYPNDNYNALASPEEKILYVYDQVLSCYSDKPQDNLVFDKPSNTTPLRKIILDNLREEGKIVINLR